MSLSRSQFKVGILVIVALVVGIVGSFLVGEQNQLFIRKNKYMILFESAAGLKTANPVQLQGVEVGRVDRVVLPETLGEEGLRVWIAIDRNYASYVRTDSIARIKTLGLLGDKYVELTSGTEAAEQIPDRGEIRAAPQTDVDQLISTGEDVVQNVVSISHSLDSILERMNRGEGLLGELTVDPEGGERITDSIVKTLESVRLAADRVVEGEGTLPRLLNDKRLADDLTSAVDRLNRILESAESGDGLLPTLLRDPEAKKNLETTLSSLATATQSLAAIAVDLKEGDGLLPRLLGDDEYGDRVLEDLEKLIRQLSAIAESLSTGDGTAARLINDPEIYEAVQDILVGIDDSKLLRWLIRNRQEAGIETRYEEALEATQEEGESKP